MPSSPQSQKRFVVTVDDPGGLIQGIPTLQRVMDFFGEESVPASFFVVPRGQGGWQLDRQEEWLAVAQQAEQQGHDCQLHGLDHGRYEFGPYPSFVFAMGGDDPQKRLHEARQESGHLWRRDLYVEKLETAIGIFDRAFGRKPQVLRTGALAQTAELYEAVAEVGMRYVSNKIVNPRGWEYIGGRYDTAVDWDPQVPPRPYYLTQDVINLPMISEYAWQLTPEKIARHLALAVEDLRRVYEADGVFLLICHVQEVGAEHPHSRVLLHRLLEVAREDYQVTFMTVRELIGDIESGAVEVRDYKARSAEGGHYSEN